MQSRYTKPAPTATCTNQNRLKPSSIRKIVKGGKYVPNELAETGHFCNEWTEWTRRLSHREYQVVSLFPSGMGMSEIAQRLFLSVKTVSTYVPFARETECPEQCATDALCLQQRHSRVKHNFR